MRYRKRGSFRRGYPVRRGRRSFGRRRRGSSGMRRRLGRRF